MQSNPTQLLSIVVIGLMFIANPVLAGGSGILPDGTIQEGREVSMRVAAADASTLTTSSTPEGAKAGSPPSLWERSRLTGDWGGARSRLEAAGVKLDLEFTLFYQGLVSGTGPETFELGNRLDSFINLDTGALGLWQGGGLTSHLEYYSGDLPGTLGETFFPTNSAMAFSTDGMDTLVASSLYFSQGIGDQTSLLVGKINVLDLLAGDSFWGGWGTHRFMNTIFVAPPSGLVPPVFFGAVATVKSDPVTLSLWVYDPEDRPQEYWPDDLFSDGVTFYFTPSYATEISGRPTTFSLVGIYTTKTGTDFNSVSEAWKAGLQPLTKEGSYSIGFQFSHLLHQSPGKPGQGWGVYMKGAVSDGNPNYVQNSIIVGIGGTGLLQRREQDGFGAGYFYYDLSDDLADIFNVREERYSDEQGAEMYYSYAVTPWFFITGDLQYIIPPDSEKDQAFIAGLRANIRF